MVYDNLGDYLITLGPDSKQQFVDLHNYYDRGSSRYMDIWAIHSEDADV